MRYPCGRLRSPVVRWGGRGGWRRGGGLRATGGGDAGEEGEDGSLHGFGGTIRASAIHAGLTAETSGIPLAPPRLRLGPGQHTVMGERFFKLRSGASRLRLIWLLLRRLRLTVLLFLRLLDFRDGPPLGIRVGSRGTERLFHHSECPGSTRASATAFAWGVVCGIRHLPSAFRFPLGTPQNHPWHQSPIPGTRVAILRLPVGHPLRSATHPLLGAFHSIHPPVGLVLGTASALIRFGILGVIQIRHKRRHCALGG